MSPDSDVFPDDSYQEIVLDNTKWLKLYQGLPLDGPAWANNLKLSGQLANSNIAQLPLGPLVRDMLDEVYAAWGVDTPHAISQQKRGGLQTDICMLTPGGFMVVEHHHHDRGELVVSLSGGAAPLQTA